VDVTNGPTGQIGDYYPTAISKNGSIVLGETGGNSDRERTLSLGGAIVRAGRMRDAWTSSTAQG
jgi:hypothetical protein